MKCATLEVALSALKNIPGQPHTLTDARGKTVKAMYVGPHFELVNKVGGVLKSPQYEAADYLAFMTGAVRLEAMDAAEYFKETL